MCVLGRTTLLLVIFGILVLASGPAHAREAPWIGESLEGLSCQHFSGQGRGVGPWDFTDPRDRAQGLEVVENAHFTPRVRTLQRGENSASPLGDLDYTIRAFPNHHRALYAMIRYATEDAFARESEQAWKSTTRTGRERAPPECYLQRATTFAPEDHRVQILAGLYFHRQGIHERARQAYQQALSLAPQSAEAHYNFGLLLTDMERYDEAREHARKAYDLGYPLEGLRRRLAAAGHPLGE